MCRHCGELGEVKPRGPVPLYCSAECRIENRRSGPRSIARDAVGFAGQKPASAIRSDVRSTRPKTPQAEDAALSDSGKEVAGRRGVVSDLRLLRRSLREARPYRMRITAYLILSLLSAPLALLTPVPLAIAVDSALGSEPLPRFIDALLPSSMTESTTGILVVAAGLLVVIALLSAAQELGTTFLQASTGEKLTLSFQSKLLTHVQRLSFAFHDARGTADSIYRIQNDARAIQNIAIKTLIPVVTAFVTLASMLVIIFRIDLRLALVALGISPMLFLYTRLYRRRMRPRYKEAHRLESSALKVVQEVLTSLRVVKAFGREDEEQERFVSKSSEGVEARISLTVGEGAFSLLVNLTTAVGTALVLFVGVNGVRDGSLTLGALLLVLSYLGQLYGPLKTLSNRSASVNRQLAGAERAFELLDEIPDVAERPNAKPIKRARGHIEFRNVSFSYDRQAQVLGNVSVEVPAGTKVGLAGRTGAGKTTFVSLLARFYDPVRGIVFLDGTDLRNYRLRDLRAQFTIMLQEPVLFSTSIANNVAYARPRATFDEIVAATRMAGAHEFVSALPDGYDTLVGERGMTLSGGERQRLSLARAFLYDAPILILDEPTSSVDIATEAAILEAMDKLMEGRTTFMIAHRRETLERCDFILEFEDGVIVPRPVRAEAGRLSSQTAQTPR